VRIFIIGGRPNIQAEIGKGLARRGKRLSLGTSKDKIIEYLRVGLDENEKKTPDAMDQSLEANIVEKILENGSKM